MSILPNVLKSEAQRAADRTEAIGRELEALDKEIEAAKTKAAELDPQVIEAVKEYEAAKAARSPTAKDKAARADALMSQRDRPMYPLTLKHKALVDERAALTYKLRCEESDSFRELAKSVDKLKRVRRLGSVPMSRGEHDYYEVELSHNLDAIATRRKIASDAARAILDMDHASMREIEKASDDWMNKIAAVNITVMKIEQVSRMAADEATGKNLPNFPDGDTIRIDSLTEKISKLEKKL
jgi:hypothetical protein